MYSLKNVSFKGAIADIGMSEARTSDVRIGHSVPYYCGAVGSYCRRHPEIITACRNAILNSDSDSEGSHIHSERRGHHQSEFSNFETNRQLALRKRVRDEELFDIGRAGA